MAVQTLINRYANDAHIASIWANNALVAKDQAQAQQAAAECRKLIAFVRTLDIEDAEHDALDLEQLDQIERDLEALNISGHGGKRSDAGRKPLAPEPTASSRITMPASYWQFVKELGAGNASLGVRRLVEHVKSETNK